MITSTTGFDLAVRPRRLRRDDAVRGMVRETQVTRDDLIMPIFVVPGSGIRREIPSMPDIYHHSIDDVRELVKEANDIINDQVSIQLVEPEPLLCPNCAVPLHYAFSIIVNHGRHVIAHRAAG